MTDRIRTHGTLFGGQHDAMGVEAMAVVLVQVLVGDVLPTGTSMVALVEVLLPSADVVVWLTVIVMLLDAMLRPAEGTN